METKKESKLCIMIIPKTQKVKRIVIPNWLPKVTIISIMIVSLITFLHYNNMSRSTTYLQEEYDNKTKIVCNLEKEITELEQISKGKDAKISKLEVSTLEIQKLIGEADVKLKKIENLQKQLGKKAGIEVASRGGVSRNINLETLEPEEGLEAIKKVLDTKESELETFINDIENRFQYLASLPNLWPAKGTLRSTFGNRRDPFGKGIRFHRGIDIANFRGTNIKAAGNGVVTFSGTKSGYGKVVIIKHNSEYSTLYAHNQKIIVCVGDKVEKGQIIAKMGTTGRTTGCHLHFEIHKNGKPIDPLTVVKR